MALPTVIGRYEVLGELATGGMAEILLGRVSGPSGFERPVVIKRILPHLARRKPFVAMFLDEARIVARIRHPNVVHVQELGQEGDELYLVMEYLEGESAAGLVKRLVAKGRALDPRLAAYVVAEACAGLHAAHELTAPDGAHASLVHRDVSPHNVFVTYQGGVKVIDFGVAKAEDRATRTEAGQIKGKWEYMAPEQCLGQEVDRRADVFALGILLYELATMRRLFKRFNEVLAVKAITSEPIVPPSRAVSGFPPRLEAVCMRALARRREDRYATAAEMRRDLLGVLREGSDEPADDLAALMRDIFAERIEEKREMLRRANSGSAVSNVPAGEADEWVEVPGVADPEPGGTQTSSSFDTPPPRPRPRSTWFGVAAILAALIGVVAFAAVRMRATSHPETRAAASAPSAAPAPIDLAPPLPSSPAESSTPATSASDRAPRAAAPRRPLRAPAAAPTPEPAPAPVPAPAPAPTPTQTSGYHRFN